MRFALFLISLLFILSGKGQDYVPFPDSLASWKIKRGYYEGDYFDFHYDSYHLEGDTVIEDLEYKKLFQRHVGYHTGTFGYEYEEYSTSGVWNLIGVIREDSTKKVWYRCLNTEGWNDGGYGVFTPEVFNISETMLLDYGLEVGDSAYFPGSIDQGYLLLTSIDFLNGKRTLRFGECGIYSWIEGEGGPNGGPFERFTQDPCNVSGWVTVVDCFDDDGIYDGFGDYDCDGYYTDIEEFRTHELSFFPNPMTTSATLDVGELKGPAILEIYDIRGKLIRTESVSLDTGVLMLQRGTLSNGSYLLRVMTMDERIEIPFVTE